MVLFSAAIPGQGGVNHVNKQWPEYWAERFAALGYVAVDCLRRRIRDDPRVRWWYAQNLLIFASEEGLERNPEPALEGGRPDPGGPAPGRPPRGASRCACTRRRRPRRGSWSAGLPRVPGLIAAGALRRVRRVVGARRPA